MHKIKHFFTSFELTIPKAIIINSIIIATAIIISAFIINPQSTNSNSVAVKNNTDPLPSILKAIGVNKSDFTKCVDSGERKDIVDASVQDGIKAGVTGTPTTFILREEGGVFYTVANISGAQDENYFKQAIDQALATTNFSKLAKFAGRPVDQNDLQEVSNPTKVYVVEYSDSECPFCTRLHPTMKNIRTVYAGKISFVYRDFPLVQIHQHAQKEAEMISCVGKLGGAKAYYAFITAIFDWKIDSNMGYIPTDSK